MILIGWVGGALVNYLADVLPYRLRPVAPFCRFCQTAQPLGNYLIWPRRCAACGQRRTVRTWVVEAMAVVAALWLWLAPPQRLGFLLGFGLLVYFGAVAVIDLEHRRVLNVMTVPAAVMGLGLAALRGMPGLISAVWGGLVGLAIFLAVALLGRGRLGAGDVKLAGVIGLAVGYPHVVSALFLGVVLGGLVSGILLLTRRIGLKSYIAYAPYLCLGALVVLFLNPSS